MILPGNRLPGHAGLSQGPPQDRNGHAEGQGEIRSPVLDTALWALDRGYWPVPITPIDDPHATAPGKQPIGKAWGKVKPTPQSLTATYRRVPTANLGLKLGAEGGIVDMDVDVPELAGPRLQRIFPDGLPETLGWVNAAGKFHLAFEWDVRFAAYGLAIIKGVLKDGKVLGNPHYLGLEIRIGAASGDGRQYQSVIPPSLLADGTPRRWNGCPVVRPAPESLFRDLERFARVKHFDRDAVLAACQPHFVELARDWGMVFTGKVLDGWAECHAVGREDHTPSAGLNLETGVYHDFGTDATLSLLDLAAQLRPTEFPDWVVALTTLGEQFGVEPGRKGGSKAQAAGGGGAAGPDLLPFPAAPMPPRNLSDLGNAERLVTRHGRDLRYCHPWKKWLVWDGRRWALDNTGAARRLARETVRSIYGEAEAEADIGQRKALAKWALVSEERKHITAMLALAEAEAGIPILPEEMDRDPWSFNCQNGTIDLRTGQLHPHRREDLITKLCPVDYDPAAECPLWDATLQLFFDDKPDLIDYWGRICGYAQTGVIRDHVLPVAYGTGSNGKSTVLGTLLEVFGPDYAMKCPPDLLMARKGDSHPTDRADLFGKRLVVAIETESGRRLNETLVKELTGGDRIRARRMREDFWEYSPTHTLIMATNHKPVVRGTDRGIWRRIRLVPFTVAIEGDRDDKGMPTKLRDEYPGILAWCVRGCLAWQARGLDAPDDVTKATADYRREQDVIGAFLAEATVSVPHARVKAGELYQRYRQWAEAGNERVVSLTEFGLDIQKRGFEKKSSNGTWYLGLGLRTDREDPPELEHLEHPGTLFPHPSPYAQEKPAEPGKVFRSVPSVPTADPEDVPDDGPAF